MSGNTWIFWVVAIIAGFISWDQEESSVGGSVGAGLVAGWVAFYAAEALL